MRPLREPPSHRRRARGCLLACILLPFGCDEAPDPVDAVERAPELGDRWLELGQGVDAHTPLVDGDTLDVYLGTQHLVMFAFTLRLGGIEVPDDPGDYTDARAPVVDLGLEVPGFDADGGFFRRVEGFPLVLSPEGDGDPDDPSYVAVFVPVIFPDAIEPEAVFGAEVVVHARVRPASGPSLEVVHTLVVGDTLHAQ